MRSTPSSVFQVRELRSQLQDSDIVRLSREALIEKDELWDFDEFEIRNTCIMIRAQTDRTFINLFLIYRDEVCVGYMLATCYPSTHSKRLVGEQKVWYVTKTARGSRAALLLLKAYEDWAVLQGASKLFTGSTNKSLAARTSSFLNKLGYVPVGLIMCKEIPNGHV